ncbi:MAG TPA: DUF6350 family protein [Catenuloplanes sp.]|jgi:hypothetical protein
MPTPPERPPSEAGAPAERADPLTAAEDAHLAERHTEPVDVRTGMPVDPAHRETVRLPAQRRGPVRQASRAPLPVAAAVATGWAALLSYLPVALVLGLAQVAENAASFTGAARTGLAGWLLGHGVPLNTAVGPLGLAPLALAAFAGWRLTRAGVHVTRAIGARGRGSLRDAGTVAGAVGVTYGLLGVLAAVLVSGPGITVSPVRAGLTLTGFGLVAALLGALRSSGALSVLAARTPAVVRHAARAGVAAALLLLAAGAGFAGLSVAMGGGEAGEMISAYRTGVAGQAGISLLSMAYAPNAAVWAAAYLLGPGFAVGADSTVRLTEVTVGALPAVPVLAGLPQGPVGGLGAALLVVPLFAGVLAGWLLARRMRRERESALDGRSAAPPWPVLLGAAALAGPVAGVVLGVLAVLSGGPVGAGRLSQIGPVAWQVAAVAAAVVAAGVLIGAAVTRAFRATGRA